jgi:hypothetical protein
MDVAMLNSVLNRRRAAVAVGAALVSIAALTLPSTGAGAASSGAPASITVHDVSSETHAPVGTPEGAKPTVIVQANDGLNTDSLVATHFSLIVSLFDSTGAATSFTKDTTLTFSSEQGTVSPATQTMTKGFESQTFTMSIASAANHVLVKVGIPAKGKTPGLFGTSTTPFDVLKTAGLFDAGPGFKQGIGGNNDCADATKTAPVCGVLILPQGATGGQAFLSLGSCDSTNYTGCSDVSVKGVSPGSVVQLLAGLNYSFDAPATLFMRCDKQLCGTGAIHNIRLNFTTSGTEDIVTDTSTTLPDCPAKGQTDVQGDPCVDYVQSTRDNSGDTLLYLLFTKDARVSFP